ncbi:MAG: NAD(P)-dependent alcohol dehydrogenase [Verrucomicrobia bacterium]|nr:NAD(P)-dependent alcohol dehydrogenase [Verrucomicrobiota bacterium]
MQALVYRRFGGPEELRLEERPAPQPRRGEVLVRQHASSLNVIDARSRRGEMAPFVNGKFPKIPGADVAGIVEQVGPGASRYRPGDRVFGATNAFHGGAMAELVAVPESALAPLPPGLDFVQAAALPIAGLAALLAVRELAHTQRGDEVLIHGGSGAAGLFALQLAKLLGARVTTVSGAAGAAASRALGADATHDYREGPVEFSRKFDVILNFSSQYPFALARPQLTPRGRFVEASPTIPKVLGSLLANPFRRQKHLMLMASARTAPLTELAQAVQAGRLRVSIAQEFPLADATRAFREQEKGGTIGKIILRIGHETR